MKAPTPLVNAFLVCRRIVDDPAGEIALVGLPNTFVAHAYPATIDAGFFIRLSSARGDYRMEVQLQTSEGDVVWRDGPPNPTRVGDALSILDMTWRLCIAIPAAGAYYVVLLANGEEIARQRYMAQLAPQQASR